jgi:alkanesulfonate monooxygenase SsuD/methylene tetrahydromethanopterin reductase-like flavin-dependent oxidoreductase (luciferase family)
MIRFGFSLQGRGALADKTALTTLAQRADALGFDSLFVTDRMLRERVAADVRPLVRG